MNLVIDKGNSRTKIAFFDGENLISVQKFFGIEKKIFQPLFLKQKIEKICLSSVSNFDDETLEFFASNAKVFEPKISSPMPIQIAYSSPETLGFDRVAAAVGAWAKKPNENAVVIDFGTCITTDLLIGGQFLGGNIAPGVEMRFRAMSEFTAKLPYISPENRSVKNFGTDTNSAISSGVMNGIFHEIAGFISAARQEFGDLNVFFTGGDAQKFAQSFENVFYDENLVLLGLNKILLYNA